jgi:ABC-type nickel/cobalt efflux system permease component RcnA
MRRPITLRAARPAPTRRILALLVLATALGAALLAPRPAAAHPLGNFSVNRYTRIEPWPGQLRLRTILDMAEIPTLQEQPKIDADADGALSAAEQDAYLAATVASLIGQIDLTADGRHLPLTIQSQRLALLPGQGGLQTLRIEAELRADLAGAAPQAVAFQDSSFADRPGWREVIVRAGDGVQILESSAPDHDITSELTSYPVDVLRGLPATSRASFRFAPGAAGAPAPAAAPAPVRGGDQLSALVQTPISGPLGLLGALLVALGLGAAHALTPGHGKTIVAAYLVGTRGTVAHAIFLGITTTVTHTAGVFAFGLITLFVSRYLLPEQLYPWLGALSGLLVCLLGAAMLRQRLAGLRRPPAADHSHADLDSSGVHSHGFGTHSHAPVADAVSWRGLLALGVSGGLLPCPSALVLLLGSIALGRVGLGLLLVLAFSLGLAGVLTLVGVLLVRARGLFSRLPAGGRAVRYLPVAGAAVVALAGLGIAVQALSGLI